MGAPVSVTAIPRMTVGAGHGDAADDVVTEVLGNLDGRTRSSAPDRRSTGVESAGHLHVHRGPLGDFPVFTTIAPFAERLGAAYNLDELRRDALGRLLYSCVRMPMTSFALSVAAMAAARGELRGEGLAHGRVELHLEEPRQYIKNLPRLRLEEIVSRRRRRRVPAGASSRGIGRSTRITGADVTADRPRVKSTATDRKRPSPQARKMAEIPDAPVLDLLRRVRAEVMDVAANLPEESSSGRRPTM